MDQTGQAERLDRELAQLAQRVEELSAERDWLRAELAEARGAVSGARPDVEANATAAAIVAGAREEAAAIRQAATTGLESLLAVREQLLEELRTLLSRYSGLLGSAAHPPSVPAMEVEPPPRTGRATLDEESAARLFGRRTEIEAGPFDDFAELSSFERSLAALPSIEDVYIRRFDGLRAVIELTFEEERPLLQDLARHVPYELHVREAGGDTIRLEIEHRAATA